MAAAAFQASDTVSAADSVWTTYPSLAVTVDSGTYWDGGEPTRLTFPANGLYLVTIFSGQEDETGTARGCRIIYNGLDPWPCGTLTRGVADDGNVARGSYTKFAGSFKAGDYLEFQGFQDQTTDDVFCHISATRLPTDNCFSTNVYGELEIPGTDPTYDEDFYEIPVGSTAFTYGGWTSDDTSATVPSTGNYLILGRIDRQASQVPGPIDTSIATGYHAAIQVKVDGTIINGPQWEDNEYSCHFASLQPLSAGDVITWEVCSPSLLGVTFESWGLTIVEIEGACASLLGPDQLSGNSAFAVAEFDSEPIDTNGFHDNATNNSRITIPSGKGGTYLLIGKMEIDTFSDSAVGWALNGVLQLAWYICNRTSWVGIFAVVELDDGDYVELWDQSDLSDPVNVNTDNYYPEFAAIRLDEFSYASVPGSAVYGCPWRKAFVPQIYRRL